MNKDFNEFLKLLNYHKVKYVIVGAHAVGVHSKPRATGDLDILVRVTITNAKKIWKRILAERNEPVPGKMGQIWRQSFYMKR